MRKGARGCVAAGKEMDTIGKELPKLQKSLEKSHTVVKTTRKALATALEQQEKLVPLLEQLTEILLGSWLSHSRTLRLSVLETIDGSGTWKQLSIRDRKIGASCHRHV